MIPICRDKFHPTFKIQFCSDERFVFHSKDTNIGECMKKDFFKREKNKNFTAFKSWIQIILFCNGSKK